MKEKLILIDGNSIAFRAFYALPLLKNASDLHTNAIYGFTLILEKLIKEEQPTHFLIAFDAGKTTFRHETFGEYKGGRQKTPQELSEQFPHIRRLAEAYQIKHYELDNYEADDIIGTLSKEATENKIETIIVTGDRDLTQLVNDYVTVYYTKKGVTDIDRYTPEFVKEKYGFGAEKIVDLKGLMGDKSDNIPGVPGVGEKTAIKLLHEYGTVEGVIANLDKITAKKLNENLTHHQQDALMSKQLATIETNAPIDVNLEDTRIPEKDETKKIELFRELEFKQMLEHIDTTSQIESDKDITIQDDYINYQFEDVETIALHLKGYQDNYLKNEILALGLIYQGLTFVIPADEICNNTSLVLLLENEAVKKNVYDAKAVKVMFERLGIKIRGIQFDVMLANYLLNPSTTVVDVQQVGQAFGLNYVESDDHIFGKGSKAHIPDFNVLKEHIANEVNLINDVTPLIQEKLISYEQLALHDELELPLAFVLADMEMQGIKVNQSTLQDMQKEIQVRLNTLTESIYTHAGQNFNVNSPKQLGVILFETLKLPVIKKTKTGYSTAVDVLEKLQGEHPIIDDILVYRTLSKLQSTYVEGLQKLIGEDGKIHTRFNQVIAQTGRLSSIDPNLQNIPVRLEEGRKIRKAFVPSGDDMVIFAADYSQIELRVLAHITEDKRMMEAFTQGIDIHTKTAMEVFNVSKEEVTSNMRRQAKAVNFGIVYGISDYGLSQSLGITRKAAQKFIDDYLDSFPNVKQYMDDIIQKAKQDGYVTTLMHRRRYIPDITSRNFNLRGFAERTAMNTPIQGSAADIIKLAMVQFDKVLKETNFKAKMLLQVHDELIFEVPKDEIEAFSLFVKDIMENALALNVPLEVEYNSGESWYEAK
ncbi:DNA polymerase I [Macrococcoides caseolyticum]|uniref:DNA polymerase I n=1 Tax=Macrococcoides caseolyticum TaxID=69966 RepID=UPI001F24A5CE|nr:DNA polymerase I [Macrococcus caseolyticus]MCE4956313.1 DNA polymerase I [Macrococcus caseolyticus]